jgi:predicted ATPase
LSRSATAEAVVQLAKGLAILEAVPHGPARQRHELALQLALGQASIAAKGFAAEETGHAYARAHELCEELGDAPELYPVLYGRSVFHFQRGELSAAHDVARELLRRGEAGNDIPAQITGHRMIGSALSQLGRLAESREHFLAALALYEPIRDRSSAIVYAIDSRVMCTSWLSHVLLLLGFPEQALARDSEAMMLARDRAHANTHAVALVWGCIFRQLLRDAPNAKLLAERVIEVSTEHGFPLYQAAGRVVHGWALADAGEVHEGVAEMHRGLTDYAGTGAQMWSPYFLGLLAEAETNAGRSRNAAELVQDALDRVGRTGARWIEPELYRVRAQVSLASRDLCSADPESDYRRSMLIASEQGSILWELRAAVGLARLWVQQGKCESAVTLLRPVYDRLIEGEDVRDIAEAKALLDSASPVPARTLPTREEPKVG